MAISFETLEAPDNDTDAADPIADTAGPVMNTTPLIDVLLVLLVMLIITIPIQLHSVRMDLPAGLPPAEAPEPLILKLDISQTSSISANGQPVLDLAELNAMLQQAAGMPVQPEIHVQAQPTTPYDTVATVLTLAQRAGLLKIGVVGLEEYAQPVTGR